MHALRAFRIGLASLRAQPNAMQFSVTGRLEAGCAVVWMLIVPVTISEVSGQARVALRVGARFHGPAGIGQDGGVRRRSARRC
jgi:hypothetical protein